MGEKPVTRSRPQPRAERTPLEKMVAAEKRHRANNALAFQLKAHGIKHTRESTWHPVVNYLADFRLEKQIIVEVDGGLYINGGHTRGAARERDYERDAEAMLLGFRVLRVSPRHVSNGKAIGWIVALLQ